MGDDPEMGDDSAPGGGPPMTAFEVLCVDSIRKEGVAKMFRSEVAEVPTV